MAVGTALIVGTGEMLGNDVGTGEMVGCELGAGDGRRVGTG